MLTFSSQGYFENVDTYFLFRYNFVILSFPPRVLPAVHKMLMRIFRQIKNIYFFVRSVLMNIKINKIDYYFLLSFCVMFYICVVLYKNTINVLNKKQ